MDVSGISIAGVETAIEVPSLRLLLDVGRCTRTAVNQPIVLVSHGHLDHVGAVAQHAARRALMGMSEGTYVVPARLAGDVEALFNAAGALDGQVIPRKVVALALGESFQLDKTRYVRPFETFHRVPSQGYTVWERRHRLLPEFRDTPGGKLGELRRNGVVIDEPHDVPLLSFTGDTRVDVLERTEELQRTETLVMEASFLDGLVSVEDARRMGHIHLEEILARTELLTRRDLVLSHFSARYRDEDVRRILEERLPESLMERTRTLFQEPSSAAARSSSPLVNERTRDP